MDELRLAFIDHLVTVAKTLGGIGVWRSADGGRSNLSLKASVLIGGGSEDELWLTGRYRFDFRGEELQLTMSYQGMGIERLTFSASRSHRNHAGPPTRLVTLSREPFRPEAIGIMLGRTIAACLTRSV